MRITERYSKKSNVLKLSAGKRKKSSYNLQAAWAARGIIRGSPQSSSMDPKLAGNNTNESVHVERIERDREFWSTPTSAMAPKGGNKCAVNGCVSSLVAQELKFYPFPTDAADAKRRKSWIEAIGKKSVPANAKLCSFHFITGSPSTSADHPDYTPTLHMQSFRDVDGKDADELNHLLKSTNSKMYPDYKHQEGANSSIHGFKRNLKPEKILNIVRLRCGLRCFLIKWKDDLCPDFVTAEDANEKCPDLVIKFYENIISWAE